MVAGASQIQPRWPGAGPRPVRRVRSPSGSPARRIMPIGANGQLWPDPARYSRDGPAPPRPTTSNETSASALLTTRWNHPPAHRRHPRPVP